MRKAAWVLLTLLPSPMLLAGGPCRAVLPRPVHEAALLGGDGPPTVKARRDELERQRDCLRLESVVQPRAEFAPLAVGSAETVDGRTAQKPWTSLETRPFAEPFAGPRSFSLFAPAPAPAPDR
jgi:hypothetical protein